MAIRPMLPALLLLTLGTAPAMGSGSESPPQVRLTSAGIGALTLGRPLQSAARQTVPLDPAAAIIGPGCDERDQINVRLGVAGHGMTVMAMADARGRIEEIIAMPRGTANAASAADCRALGEAFAASLAPRLGPPGEAYTVRKPVSDEFIFRYRGDAYVLARWFAGGSSCDLALHFERRN